MNDRATARAHDMLSPIKRKRMVGTIAIWALLRLKNYPYKETNKRRKKNETRKIRSKGAMSAILLLFHARDLSERLNMYNVLVASSSNLLPTSVLLLTHHLYSFLLQGLFNDNKPPCYERSLVMRDLGSRQNIWASRSTLLLIGHKCR